MDKLQELIENGLATYGKVIWGSGTRNAVIIEGKKYQYNKNKEISKTLQNNLDIVYNNKHKFKSKKCNYPRLG